MFHIGTHVSFIPLFNCLKGRKHNGYPKAAESNGIVYNVELRFGWEVDSTWRNDLLSRSEHQQKFSLLYGVRLRICELFHWGDGRRTGHDLTVKSSKMQRMERERERSQHRNRFRPVGKHGLGMAIVVCFGRCIITWKIHSIYLHALFVWNKEEKKSEECWWIGRHVVFSVFLLSSKVYKMQRTKCDFFSVSLFPT